MGNADNSMNNNFNEYISIILINEEHSDIIFEEIKSVEHQNNLEMIKTYTSKFLDFDENYVLNKSKIIPNLDKKFMFVDKSFELIKKINRLKNLL